MLNKSLVSIYFLPDLLLIAELDSKKEYVKKWAKVPLPEGIIEDYRIKNVPELAKVIKKAFLDKSISEKDVGIIVPEFSTFSKLITLPKLALSELNEAVMWQAGEYLPEGSENMVIDWKIIERTENNTTVLIAAINKDILTDYVLASELAGLFPRGVKTPSLCLTPLTSKEEAGSLLLYSGLGETILMLCHGERIIGTSVLNNAVPEEIINTASRMINHYKGEDIKKVFVCGAGMSDEILVGMKNNLKIEIVPLKTGVSGLTPIELEELIIPISLLTGDLEEPSNTKTINLLPLTLIEKYKFRKNRIEVWTLSLTVTLFAWFCFLIIVGSYLVISQQISTLKNKNQKNLQSAGKLELYESQSKKINDTSVKILKVKSVFVSPIEVLNTVTSAKPGGVTIGKYKMDFDRGSVELSGISVDRESLLSFKTNLESSPKITSVDIPISNFEKVNNLEFTLTFSYNSKNEKTR